MNDSSETPLYTPENTIPEANWLESTVSAEQHERVRLFKQLVLMLVIALVGLSWASPLSLNINFFQGLAICALSALPILVWSRTMAYPYPFFEIYLAMCAPAYGIPLLWENQNVIIFGEETFTYSAWAVLLFLAASIATFYSFRLRPKNSPFWTRPIFRRPSPSMLLGATLISVLYLVINKYIFFFPSELQGTLRAVFYGLFMASVFMLSVMWGQGSLTLGQRIQLVLLLGLNFFALSAGLVLRDGTSFILLAMVGYFLGSRTVPWKALIVFFAFFSILNLGKYHMRGLYWFESERSDPTLSQLPSFYSDWIGAGLNSETTDNTSSGRMLIERSSLLQMLCLVVQKSPDQAPFLEGKTYSQTLGQFVPRFLWPDKPRGHISTYTLAVHYGLQTEEATVTTTIAFGFISEAFANFGLAGIAGIGIFMAAAYRLLVSRTYSTPILSFGGIVVIMVTAWSFQTEHAVSIWLTSLFQALVGTLTSVWAAQRIIR